MHQRTFQPQSLGKLNRISRFFLQSGVLLLLVCPHFACAGPTTQPTTQPASPIHYVHEVRANPPLHLHIITVDLTDPAVSIVVRPGANDPDGEGPWQTALATVRAIAARDDLAVAVNGDFFAPKDSRNIAGRKVPYYDGNWAKMCGYAMSEGKIWATPMNNHWAALEVKPQNAIEIISPGVPIAKDAVEVVGGLTKVVTDGKVSAKSDDLAPRTSAGIDKTGKKLTLLVVDGRRPEYSVGMKLDELGAEMLKLGCEQAINLDGGGSSTMVLRNDETGKLECKNRPSDGHDFIIPLSVERPVANVLGIRIKKDQPAK